MQPLILFVLLSLLTFARAAGAAPVLATPLADPPDGGRIYCVVNNIGTKDVTVEIAAYTGAGGVAAQTTYVLSPKNSVSVLILSASSHFCTATVLKGGKRSVRLAVQARDSASEVVTTLPGN